jgi:hypothetical protein
MRLTAIATLLFIWAQASAQNAPLTAANQEEAKTMFIL